MVAIFTAADRRTFKQCRRAWDFGSGVRRNLEPIVSMEPLNVDRSIRDALAVYYFPGMWDWSRAVVVPLVAQALDKAVASERERLGPELPRSFETRAEAARQLLDAYMEWSPTVERLAPVLVEVDYWADVPDPEREDSALCTSSGQAIRYQGRVDLLAVDEHDAYWIVRHRVVNEWTSLETLMRDEEALAACWAWGRYYIGMEISGTIHNEMCLPTHVVPDGGALHCAAENAGGARGGVPQHEGSGGGRSVPQHRRLYAQSSEPTDPERVVHDTGPWFRRTYIRRSRSEVSQVARQLALEAGEMFNPEVAVYPAPSESWCGRCPFAAPCLALYEKRDAEAEAIVTSSYRPRRHEEAAAGRLGGATWSTGRGAAPPQFPRDRA
jgi:hypothetical protein